VVVTVEGEVEFNSVSAPPLGPIPDGAPATMTFEVDAGVFVDDPSFPTRGYPIDPASFSLTMGGVTVGLANPLPQPAYFVLRDNDPAVDGFMLSDSTSFPTGVPLAVGGAFGAFRDNFYVTYGGSLLSSLDITLAAGSYDFTGLAVFNWTITDGPFDPIGLLFSSLTIDVAIADPLLWRGDCNGDAAENIADAVFLLSVLFPPPGGAPTAPCQDSCDANDDGTVDIADAVAILGALFGSPATPLPPPTGGCGFDGAQDSLSCDATPNC
jgi:hypothetical protein